MKRPKATVLGLVAVGFLATAFYLLILNKPKGNPEVKPPENAHKIADAALKSYFEQHSIVPVQAYLLKRSGTESGRYYFDYSLSPDYVLSGGYFVYHVTVGAGGTSGVKGMPFTERL